MSTAALRGILLLAAVAWGGATTATAYALAGFGPLTLLTVKLVGATAVLWAVALARGIRPARIKAQLAAMAVFEPLLAYGALTVGLVWTTATNGSLLGATESCFVVLLAAVVLRERVRVRSALGLVIALVGVLALGEFSVTASFTVGDVIVLVGSLAAAIYVVSAARVAPSIDATTMTTWLFTFATLMSLPAMVVAWVVGVEEIPIHTEARYWGVALAIGGIGFALGFVLYNRAIRDVPAGLAGVILNAAPVVGVLTAVLFLGEELTVWTVVGAVLILGGILVFPAEKDGVVAPDPVVGATAGRGRS